MIKALATMLFSVLLCLGSVVDGSAQQSTTQGWVFGFDLGGEAVSFENKPSGRGVLVGPPPPPPPLLGSAMASTESSHCTRPLRMRTSTSRSSMRSTK